MKVENKEKHHFKGSITLKKMRSVDEKNYKDKGSIPLIS